VISLFNKFQSFNLKQLNNLLNRDFGGAAILAFGVLLYYHPQLAFIIFLCIAAIFTPLMIVVLFREKRYGWLIFFFLFVLIPSGISYSWLQNFSIPGLNMIAYSVPIVLFLLYCFLLKVSIAAIQDE